MDETSLRRIARRSTAARQRLRDAVIEARSDGLTIRAISEATQLSTQTVQRWTKEKSSDARD